MDSFIEILLLYFLRSLLIILLRLLRRLLLRLRSLLLRRRRLRNRYCRPPKEGVIISSQYLIVSYR